MCECETDCPCCCQCEPEPPTIEERQRAREREDARVSARMTPARSAIEQMDRDLDAMVASVAERLNAQIYGAA